MGIIELPFTRWEVKILNPGQEGEIVYDMGDADSSVRLKLDAGFGPQSIDVLARNDSLGVDLRVGSAGPALTLTGPAAVVIEYDDAGYPYFRLATDEDVRWDF